MAYLGKDNRITGSIGDLIFRNVDGKTIVQRKPEKYQVKQSKRTKKASSDFGRASSVAKKIRIGIQTYTRGFSDSKSFCRLRTRLQRAATTDNQEPLGKRELWDGKPELLEGFEFNHHSKYEHYVRLSMNNIAIAAKKLQFQLAGFHPKQDITWPTRAKKAKLCFWMSVHRRKDDLSVQEELFQLEITPGTAVLPETNFTSKTLKTNSLVYL